MNAALMSVVDTNIVEDSSDAAKVPDDFDVSKFDIEALSKALPHLSEHPTAKKEMVGRQSMNLGEITQHNIQQLRMLNQAVFPVSYNDKFYQDVITSGDLAKLAFYNDVIIGAVCCRYDTFESQKSLYIMTLGTLAPYRSLGIGTMMLNYVFKLCDKDPSIKNVVLHVQVNNDVALKFYKKFGFEVREEVHDYYKRITPTSAYLVVKPLEDKEADAAANNDRQSK